MRNGVLDFGAHDVRRLAPVAVAATAAAPINDVCKNSFLFIFLFIYFV
jgi:hypothetical protein